MNAIFYCAGKNGYYDNLSSLTAGSSLRNNIEIYSDIETLSRRLQRPHANKSVAVICAETFDDLIDIYLIKHLLSGTALILILPDDERDTLAMGSLLKPLFTFDIDTDASDIRAALYFLTTHENYDIKKNHSAYQQRNEALSSFKLLRYAS